MISTKNIDVNLAEAAFYEKDFSFSYSSLNKLLTAPPAFYKEYVLGIREETHAKYLLEGIIIHYLVLENQGFDEKFIVLADKLPGTNNTLVADAMFEVYKELKDPSLQLIDFSPQILEHLKEINLHQSLKDTKDGTGDSKRIAKIVEPRTEDYFEFLKSKGNKTIIDSALLDKCTARAEVIKNNPEMRSLLGMDVPKQYGVYNELYLVKKNKHLPFDFKGIIDNLVVDVKAKTIRINDFKTTGKSLVNFQDSVDFWKYWLQAAMYMTLVKEFLKDILSKDSTWKIEFRFIVFDKHDQLYPFLVSESTMQNWQVGMESAISDALYHYNNKDFKLPHAFAVGNVIL